MPPSGRGRGTETSVPVSIPKADATPESRNSATCWACHMVKPSNGETNEVRPLLLDAGGAGHGKK